MLRVKKKKGNITWYKYLQKKYTIKKMSEGRDIIIYNNKGEIRTVSSVNSETERVNPALIKKKSPLKCIIIVGISVVLISVLVVGIYFGVKKKKDQNKNHETNYPNNDPNEPQDNTQNNDIIVNHAEKSKKLENEFQFNTKQKLMI